MRRVVVTGMGAVSPVGNTVARTWDHLLAGKSGIQRLESIPVDDLKTQFGGECRDFDPLVALDDKARRHTGRFIHLAIAAAAEAVAQAGPIVEGLDPFRAGVLLGVGMSGLDEVVAADQVIREEGPRRMSPFFIPSAVANLAAGQIAIRFGLQGVSFCPTSACTSGAHAIGEAFHYIRMGKLDCAVAGGAEANINRIAFAGFGSMRALSTRNDEPHRASRPFDQDRDGFVLSEGSAVLVLEEEERARRRGATILAELSGYGTSTDAFHITRPTPGGEALLRAMRESLREAELRPEHITYVNAHATSTPAGDEGESKAIRTLFGDAAQGLWVSATKSMTGHLLGASGALEAMISIQALRTGAVPPTINLDRVDPECAGLDFVPHQARERRMDAVMSNSSGFGGSNVVLTFKRHGASPR